MYLNIGNELHIFVWMYHRGTAAWADAIRRRAG